MKPFFKNRGIPIDGSRVVLTGASSGIGRATAFALSKKGARTALAARRRDPLLKTAAAIAIECDCETPLVVPCRVEDASSYEHLVETAVEHLGGVDILINCAGSCIYGAATSTSDDDVKTMFDVHVLGAFHGMQAAIPYMRKQGRGLIVNVSSVAGLHGVPYLAAYGAAKAAQVVLSQSINAELHGTGIRVISVCPGYTDTNLFAVEKKVGGARRPSRRYRPPEAVAASIVKSIERGSPELVMPFEGKLLTITQSLSPALVETALDRIARTLREDYSHA